MKVIQVSEKVKQFFSVNLVPIHKIVSVIPADNGWELEVEVIEEKEYMVASAKDEMIGVYKVVVDRNLEIVSFVRTNLRSRSAMVSNINE